MSVLPPEILEGIFSCLPSSDLKQVSLTSVLFRELAAPFLWREPAFREFSISIESQPSPDDLSITSIRHLPIQRLKLSQFQVPMRMDGQEMTDFVRELVELVKKNLNLIEFHVDKLPGMHLNMPQIENLLQLPVTRLHSGALSHRVLDDPTELFDLLMSQKSPPEIQVSKFSRSWLEIENWKSLVKLPLHSVVVSGQLGGQELQEFCDVARIARNADGKQTKFYLHSIYAHYSPEDLMPFKGLHISELSTDYLNIKRYSVADFVKVIEEINPTWLRITSDYETNRKLSVDDLQLLFKFKIRELHADALAINASNEEEFVRLICDKHKDCPIVSGVLVFRGSGVGEFSAGALQLLEDAGLNLI